MLLPHAFRLICASLLSAGLTLAQCDLQVRTRTVDTAWGKPDPVLLALELRRDATGARLELRGGIPGNAAAVCTGFGACATADDGRAKLPADSPHTCGSFDAQGCFLLPIDLRALAGSTVSCQGHHAGYTADGDDVDQTSAVLEITVTEVVAAPSVEAPAAAAPDFSFLCIGLGANRRDEVIADLRASDFAGALDAALNSAGDNLQVKVSGKVMIKVNGIDVGGSVTFTARMARDKDDYTVAIGRDLAVLAGLKATDDIGLEGGIGFGADEIYRFATSGDAARGLLGIALQQALGPSVELLADEHRAQLDAARARLESARAALQAYRQRLPRLRVEAVETALAAAGEARARDVAQSRPRVAAVVRVLRWIEGEVRFVREHVDGVELRASLIAKAEVKIGSKTIDVGTGSFGVRTDRKVDAVVRLWQAFGGPVSKVEVRTSASSGTALTAGLLRPLGDGKLSSGIDVEFRPSFGDRTTYERDAHGNFGAPAQQVELKGMWKVGPLIREIVLAVDKQQLGDAGTVALQHLVQGDLTGGWGPLLGVPFTVTVQDKLCRALRPGVGWGQGFTAKVGLDLSWTDAGSKRQLTTTLPVMVQALTDPANVAAVAMAMVQQVQSLPSYLQ